MAESGNDFQNFLRRFWWIILLIIALLLLLCALFGPLATLFKPASTEEPTQVVTEAAVHTETPTSTATATATATPTYTPSATEEKPTDVPTKPPRPTRVVKTEPPVSTTEAPSCECQGVDWVCTDPAQSSPNSTQCGGTGCHCEGTTLYCEDGTIATFNPACGVHPAPNCTPDLVYCSNIQFDQYGCHVICSDGSQVACPAAASSSCG